MTVFDFDRSQRDTSRAAERVRCTGIRGTGSPKVQSLPSVASQSSLCSQIHHLTPTPSPVVVTTPTLVLPTSKSELSAMLACGKLAVARMCYSNPELQFRNCKKVSSRVSSTDSNAGSGLCQAVCETDRASDPNILSSNAGNATDEHLIRLPNKGWEHTLSQ